MDFTLAVLVLLPVLRVNDSGELISGSAHFKGRIEIDSTKSPATADVGKRLSCTRASRAAQEHVSPQACYRWFLTCSPELMLGLPFCSWLTNLLVTIAWCADPTFLI